MKSSFSWSAARVFGPALLVAPLAFGVAVSVAASDGTARLRSAPTPGLEERGPAGHPTHVSRVPALEAEAEAWVERTLASLTLRQKVAQLVMPWVPGDRGAPNSAEFRRMLRWVEEDEVGGLIISRGAPAAIAARLNAAQARARVPLLVSSDLESGPAMRLSPGGTYFPPAMAFTAAGEETLVREAGRITGIEARAVGIHLTLGPILDVNSNPDNPIINVRSFGEQPAEVARLATVWVAGAREAGLLAAGKHFPGHGNTDVDSHVGLPTIRVDSAGLDSIDLAPFRAAIDAGIDAVLVGHIAATGISGAGAIPASLSPRAIQGVLRGRLGFQGLVVTDALNMGAITRHYSVTEASILAILAGADILLQPPGTTQVIDGVVAAVRSGRIPEERIDESARRVLAAKAAAGLHHGSGGRVDSGALRTRVGTARHREVAEQLSSASITLARDTRTLVPLDPAVRSVLHLTYAPAGNFTASSLSAELRAAGLTVQQASIGDRTTRAQLEALKARAAGVDLVIASAHVTPREYRALRIDGDYAQLVEGLAALGPPVVAVSFGSPYLLSAFPSVPAYMLAWSGSELSQRSAGRALLGQAPVRGTLPVSLPPHHRAGDGVAREIRAR